jgi:alcohol dehydrogenase class IV
MFFLKAAFCRIFQTAFRIALPVLPYREPEIITSCSNLDVVFKKENISSVLVVTDKGIVSNGLVKPVENVLNESGITYSIYDNTMANPTVDNVEESLYIYKMNHCNAIIAIGGGSVLDSAKLIGARFSNPTKTLKQMKGYFKVRRRIPYMIAVPTTSGSGSEATIVGVVTNEVTHEKYAITSPKLIPHMVVLDPVITTNLPAFVTATTGMDALTHALECYIGKANTKLTKKQSIEAIKKIWVSLEIAVKEPTNLKERNAMQEASFLAGSAFTRGFVGYVHALAHPLGGFYNTPHGLANAVILPKVLKRYGDSIYKDMYVLYIELGYKGLSKKEATSFLIEEIEKLNERIGIPNKIKDIKEEDIEKMVKRCIQEAHPMYPVPRFLTKDELINIYKELM